MKFKEIGVNSEGKKIYWLALGEDEARILLSLINKAHLWTPKVFETTKIRGRINNMRLVLKSLIPELPSSD